MPSTFEDLKQVYFTSVEDKPQNSSEIRIILDSYEDIFSDFDPRPYNIRALSTDFLEEIERASVDKHDETIELTLLVPKKIKKTHNEEVIRKRLHEHFMKHFHHLKKERNGLYKEGVWFIIGGLLLMIIATFFLFKHEDTSFIITFLTIICEPGGWFLFWEGLNLLIFESKKINPKLNFYRKMHTSKINFFEY
jgi:hypothetical protein